MQSMSNLEVVFESLKLAGTIGIGVIATIIALKQSQINARKLRLDLYEKRLRVFYETLNFIRTALGDLNPKVKDLFRFSSKTKEAVFLFNKDIIDYLDVVSKNSMRLQFLSGRIEYLNRPGEENHKANDFDKRPAYIEERADLSIWFSNQPKHMGEIFKPYMTLLKNPCFAKFTKFRFNHINNLRLMDF